MNIIHDKTARDMLGDTVGKVTRATLRSREDCVVMLNDEGRIVQVSNGSLKAFEFKTEDLMLGHLWWRIWPESAHEILREAVSRGLSGHITHYWGDYEHADGTVSQWDIRLTPVYDETASVHSVIAVSRNLTTH